MTFCNKRNLSNLSNSFSNHLPGGQGIGYSRSHAWGRTRLVSSVAKRRVQVPRISVSSVRVHVVIRRCVRVHSFTVLAPFAFQMAVRPPSTASFGPWIKLERSIAKETIASAISSAAGGRLGGQRLLTLPHRVGGFNAGRRGIHCIDTNNARTILSRRCFGQQIEGPCRSPAVGPILFAGGRTCKSHI